MPTKPPRPCSHPGCPELVTTSSRCQAHTRDEHKRKTRVRMQSERNREDKRFYDSAIWLKLRAFVLRTEPWCRECKSQRRMALAEVVDHITPISAGGARTNLENLQPLCHACHNRKRWRESKGVASGMPVHIVCGPPGSGKSTWVKERAGIDDLVIDLDLLATALSVRGYLERDVHERPQSHVSYAIAARDAVLSSLASKRDVIAWVITSGARASDRQELRRRFDAQVTVLEVSPVECLTRLAKDERRRYQVEGMRDVIQRWWDEYRPAEGENRVAA